MISKKLSHIRWMLNNMPNPKTKTNKWMRWLGFAQGVVWAKGVMTVGALKVMNYKHMDEAPKLLDKVLEELGEEIKQRKGDT